MRMKIAKVNTMKGAVWHYLAERGHAAYIWEIKRLAKIPAGYEAYARDIRAI